MKGCYEQSLWLHRSCPVVQVWTHFNPPYSSGWTSDFFLFPNKKNLFRGRRPSDNQYLIIERVLFLTGPDRGVIQTRHHDGENAEGDVYRFAG